MLIHKGDTNTISGCLPVTPEHQAQALEYQLNSFNKQYNVGSEFTVEGLSALGVGVLQAPAYIDHRQIFANLFFTDDTIPVNIQRLKAKEASHEQS